MRDEVVKINIIGKEKNYTLHSKNRVWAEEYIRDAYNVGVFVIPKEGCDTYIPAISVIEVKVIKEDINSIVNEFEETRPSDLGWKQSYNNFLECYNNKETYSEEIEAVTKEELQDLKSFWLNESIVKEYIKSVQIYFGSNNTGALFIDMK